MRPTTFCVSVGSRKSAENNPNVQSFHKTAEPSRTCKRDTFSQISSLGSFLRVHTETNMHK